MYYLNYESPIKLNPSFLITIQYYHFIESNKLKEN